MVLWQVSRDLGLVENQFLWQIPLVLALFFGLAYSLLDDIVEWVEEKWEELREFLGCEEEESVFDKVAAALESWVDARLSRWKGFFAGLFAVFVIRLIAALIAVLVAGLFSLYVWLGREFQQAGFFFMTIENFYLVVVSLTEFCVKLWFQSFQWQWGLCSAAFSVVMAAAASKILVKFVWNLWVVFEVKKALRIFRAIFWTLLTITTAAVLIGYYGEAVHLWNLCWTLQPQIKFLYATFKDFLDNLYEYPIEFIENWVQITFLYWGFILFSTLSLARFTSWSKALLNGLGLALVYLGAFYMYGSYCFFIYLLAENFVLYENYFRYLRATSFFIIGLSTLVCGLIILVSVLSFLFQGETKKKLEKDVRKN